MSSTTFAKYFTSSISSDTSWNTASWSVITQGAKIEASKWKTWGWFGRRLVCAQCHRFLKVDEFEVKDHWEKRHPALLFKYLMGEEDYVIVWLAEWKSKWEPVYDREPYYSFYPKSNSTSITFPDTSCTDNANYYFTTTSNNTKKEENKWGTFLHI